MLETQNLVDQPRDSSSLYGGPVAWSSRRQSSVALPTTEAEFVAACEAAKQAVWMKRLMNDITTTWNGSYTLFCDNLELVS